MDTLIDLTHTIGRLRTAFNTQILQCFWPHSRPSYTNACAVGVLIGPDVSMQYDDTGGYAFSPNIRALYDDGVFRCPPEQLDDFVALQRAHDLVLHSLINDAVHFDDHLAQFDSLITIMEHRYIGHPCHETTP